MALDTQLNKETELVETDRQATPLMFAWMQQYQELLARGFTGTVTLAKLTGLGANGSLTVENGIITSYTAPT